MKILAALFSRVYLFPWNAFEISLNHHFVKAMYTKKYTSISNSFHYLIGEYRETKSLNTVSKDCLSCWGTILFQTVWKFLDLRNTASCQRLSSPLLSSKGERFFHNDSVPDWLLSERYYRVWWNFNLKWRVAFPWNLIFR